MTEIFVKSILAQELFGYRVCESVEDIQIINYFYGYAFYSFDSRNWGISY